MMKNYWLQFEEEKQQIDSYLQKYFSGPHSIRSLKIQTEPIQKLIESVNYTLLNGGKRFRPTLSLVVADILGLKPERVLPFAAAVEMVHTYSLIHDDLPVMDDDSERRGKPSNHKVYGEAMALLAGDTLLTEAFFCISKSYQQTPEVAQKLVLLLSDAIGVQGMVGGQVLDIFCEQQKQITQDYLKQMHNLKTGALIAVSIEGVSVIGRTSLDLQKALSDYGALLGLAFQLADDCLDFDSTNPESQSYVTQIGMEETTQLLDQVVGKALGCLEVFDEQASPLRDLALFVKDQVKELHET